MKIRRLEEKDDQKMAAIILECLTEYDCAGRMDTALVFVKEDSLIRY